MKRFFFFLTTLFFILGTISAFGAPVKKPTQNTKKTIGQEETNPLETHYHALIIGNNQYKHLPKLKTAKNDAAEVEKLLREKFKFQTEILLDATRANILGKINEIRKRLGEKDSLLIYYAGHGEYDKDVGKAYWLPSDAQRDDPTNWIMADDITSNIKRMAARHILIVSDSCYSGTLTRQAVTELITTGGRESYLKKMQGRPSRTLMASGGNEPVSDSGGGNNSVFAAAFLKSLKESEKETFTAEEIFHSRIKEIVAGKSDQVPEYGNIKNSGHEGGDFIFKLAKIEVEPLKTEADIKIKTMEEEDRIRREQQKHLEEQAKIADDKKRLEEQIKLEKERAKVAEEKALWEAKKKEAEEQSKRQQEAQQKLAEERTGLEMERKRLKEERKLEEAKKQKLEEEKKRLGEEKAKKPALSQLPPELLSLIPEYTISQPTPTDPPEVKALLGIWTGKWSGHQDSILIVTSIDIALKRAYVIYAWGDPPPTSTTGVKKGYSFYIAEFVSGSKPTIKWGRETDHTKFEFVLKRDKLEGSKWWYRSHPSYAIWVTMTKTPMEPERPKEERKQEEEKSQKLEEKKALGNKEVNKPVLSQPWLELSSLLPEYQISPPDPKDPPEVQKLLGMWIGKWNQPNDYNILVVTAIDITKKRANVFYVWSNSYSAYDGIKAYSAHIAEFVPGEEPVIKWGDGSNSPQYEFVLKKDELVESRWLRSSTKWGTLTKVPMD